MAKEKEELYVVTEIGTFAGMNINDPTAKKVKKKQEELDALIEQTNAENKKNLTEE